jgi:hypothetical protein
VKLEPPEIFRSINKGAQAATQIQYSYFLDSKSENCFSNPNSLCLNPRGEAAANSWNLTVTYSHTNGGDCTQ